MSRTRASRLSIWRGDTLVLNITGLGDITARTALYFTAKEFSSDADSAAQIQISEAGGLLYINGATAATPANGSITIVDAANGKITVTLAAEETAKLANDWLGYFDVQVEAGGIIETRRYGNCQIIGDTTRAVT